MYPFSMNEGTSSPAFISPPRRNSSILACEASGPSRSTVRGFSGSNSRLLMSIGWGLPSGTRTGGGFDLALPFAMLLDITPADRIVQLFYPLDGSKVPEGVGTLARQASLRILPGRSTRPGGQGS